MLLWNESIRMPHSRTYRIHTRAWTGMRCVVVGLSLKPAHTDAAPIYVKPINIYVYKYSERFAWYNIAVSFHHCTIGHIKTNEWPKMTKLHHTFFFLNLFWFNLRQLYTTKNRPKNNVDKQGEAPKKTKMYTHGKNTKKPSGKELKSGHG